MFRSPTARIGLVIFGIFILYVLGIFVRRAYGLRMVITNESGEALHQVSLKFEGWNYRNELPLPDLAPGQRKHVFMKLGRKSHISLEFTDPRNVRHSEGVEGYVFADECGSMTVTVLPNGTVSVTMPTHPLICWESWFGFIW